MCGRYRLSKRKQLIEEHFDTVSGDEDWSPRYNVAPTQPVPVIRQNPKEPVRQMALVRWGLIPPWAKDASDAARRINARSETAAMNPVFRDALKSRRCLVPADGFYEWQKTGKTKQPFCFEVNNGALFAFAGLWDRWRQPDNTMLESCAILTTPPNSMVAEMHDRMPAILKEEDYDLWLDPGITDPERVGDCLKPFDPKFMKKYPVSDRVNRPENDDAACAQEIPPDHVPRNLFEPPSNPS